MARADSPQDSGHLSKQETGAAKRNADTRNSSSPDKKTAEAATRLNADDRITQRMAEAVERGLDPKQWIVVLIRTIGWRQTLFMLAGFSLAWALAYFGILPPKHRVDSKAGIALERFLIETIESRDDATASPPTDFIAKANSYVLISGFSAFRAVENNPDTLRTLLDKGVEIYMLVLDPRSPDVALEEEIDPGLPIRRNQRTIVETVVTRYSHYPNFHLKFMKMMPGITGIVVDAEIEPRTNRPGSHGAKLRFQIRGFRIPQRRGFVVQLAQAPNEDNPMFNLFWEDFRAQWRMAQTSNSVLGEIGIPTPP